MKTLLFGLIFISPPFLKRLLLRWFCKARIGHQARIGWFASVIGREIELGEHSSVGPFTLVNVSGAVRLGSYSEISSFNLIYGSSDLVVGDDCYIGPQCLINADETVRIGNGSALGPRSMVFTHGSFLPYTEGYWVKLAGVTIGNRVWCAAGVFIHPGVEIGDETFVNSMSVVTQHIPTGSVAEGNPAKVIHSMERVKRRMSPRRVDAVLEEIVRNFAEIVLRRELGLQAIKKSERQLCFRWRGQPYLITLIPSNADLSGHSEASPGARQIFVVNRSDWPRPPGSLVFDVTTGQTHFTSDRAHTALRLFMQRYYGVRFKDLGKP